MSINYLELILTFSNTFVTFPAGSRERKGVHGVLHFVHHVHDWHHDHCYSFALQLWPRSPGIAESRCSFIAKRSACLFFKSGQTRNQINFLLYCLNFVTFTGRPLRSSGSWFLVSSETASTTARISTSSLDERSYERRTEKSPWEGIGVTIDFLDERNRITWDLILFDVEQSVCPDDEQDPRMDARVASFRQH